MDIYRSLVVAVALTGLLTACGSKEEESASAPPSEAAAPAEQSDAATAPEVTIAAQPETATVVAQSSAPAGDEATAPADDVSNAGEKYAEAIEIFRNAGASGTFFDRSYGFAIFPTIGKAGLGVGGAHGKGRVYVGGQHVGDTALTQLSIGFQAGAQAYSQIIFFEDRRAFDEFSSGSFEFGAEASAVAITAAVSAGASTAGAGASASGGKHDAATVGSYQKGMAVFTVAKGGLMYEASIGGQKFSYTPI